MNTDMVPATPRRGKGEGMAFTMETDDNARQSAFTRIQAARHRAAAEELALARRGHALRVAIRPTFTYISDDGRARLFLYQTYDAETGAALPFWPQGSLNVHEMRGVIRDRLPFARVSP